MFIRLRSAFEGAGTCVLEDGVWCSLGIHRVSSVALPLSAGLRRVLAVRKAAIESRRILPGRRSTRWGQVKHLCKYASDDLDEHQSRRRLVHSLNKIFYEVCSSSEYLKENVRTREVRNDNAHSSDSSSLHPRAIGTNSPTQRTFPVPETRVVDSTNAIKFDNISSGHSLKGSFASQ